MSDKVYQQVLSDIYNYGVSDKTRDVRAKYKDGEPAYALSLPHPVIMQFDASKGEFPYTTVRPLAWKSSLKEIDWIYRDKSNSVDCWKINTVLCGGEHGRKKMEQLVTVTVGKSLIESVRFMVRH